MCHIYIPHTPTHTYIYTHTIYNYIYIYPDIEAVHFSVILGSKVSRIQ